MKTCTDCKLPKPLPDFPKDRTCIGGHSHQCLPCKGLRRRNARLLREYGITAAQYDAMLVAQGNLCACCREPEQIKTCRNGATDSFCVDHDHTTNLPRALLCRRCNSVLGLAQDNPILLQSLEEYLRFWEQQHRG